MKKEVLAPCPCCGNKRLYTGHLYSTTMGVECIRAYGGCSLSIRSEYPQQMVRGLKSLKELDAYILKKAIKAWNRRVPKNGRKEKA